MTMTRTAKQLVQVAKDIGLDLDRFDPPFKIRRTRAGRHQKSAGYWSFYLEDSQYREVAGSIRSAAEIIKAHKEKRVEVAVFDVDTEFIVKD